MKIERNSMAFAWLVLIALSIVWGTSFVLIKMGLKTLAPADVGAIRVVAAYLVLLPLAIRSLYTVKTEKYIHLLLSGLLGIVIPAFLFPLAQTQMNSSLAGILNALTPIFTLVVGVLLFQQTTTLLKVTGLLLGLSGSLIIIFTGAKGELSFNYFALFIVAATICYAFNVNMVKKYLQDLKPMEVSTLSLFFSAPFALIYLLFFSNITTTLATVEGSAMGVFYIVLLGLLSTAIASIFFYQLVQLTTPVFASSVTYTMPIVALVWGLAIGEQLFLGHYIGMITIIGGVYLANKPENKPKIET
ncbi:MAG: DMT family transporter [Cytophagales bacterium]|nr:MAG: DMT family transporter [Cytophagales bacterium]